uniref:Uncharacterized protein n=1 Tax=Arundo donax TaxID=35708 RepID=A0A0A9CXU3_ARUDO
MVLRNTKKEVKMVMPFHQASCTAMMTWLIATKRAFAPSLEDLVAMAFSLVGKLRN